MSGYTICIKKRKDQVEMKCPYCNHPDTRVIDSRPAEDGNSIRRRIGEIVMEELKGLDEVAYVRFASVYREFKDVNTFMDELKKILK